MTTFTGFLIISTGGGAVGGATTYDSGWFPVDVDTTYTKPHGLGDVPFMVQLWISDTLDGSGRVVVGGVVGGWDSKGVNIVDVDSTNIKIRAHSWFVGVYDADGVKWEPSSAHARIKAIAF